MHRRTKAVSVVLASSGSLIERSTIPWCPNDGQASRLGPRAATTTAFLDYCGTHPFTRSQRWGIDRGWARQVLSYGINPPDKRLGDRAVLELSMGRPIARVLGIGERNRTVRLDVDVKHVTDDLEPGSKAARVTSHGTADKARATSVQSAATSSRRLSPAVPSDAARRIPAATLPDLVALPAFGTSTHDESGRDYLDFAATVYNGGRGPLVAEGFRRGSTRVMDAYQFFYRGTQVVGSARVGTMGYDARPSHQHWHFEDFATYDLVNRHHHRVRTSGKEAFCLAPTDAIDMLLRGAVLDPGDGNLSTACGDVTSIWVREVLSQGWGDTYTQDRAGQSIDITGLPNGTYWIRVAANPADRLHEVSHANNTSLRRVVLGGKPGDRTVRVPRYGRVDSEAQVQDLGGGPVD